MWARRPQQQCLCQGMHPFVKVSPISGDAGVVMAGVALPACSGQPLQPFCEAMDLAVDCGGPAALPHCLVGPSRGMAGVLCKQ